MAKSPQATSKPQATKKARMIKMLSGKKPISLDKLSSALEWQLHTTRAALSRLNVEGMELVSEKPNQKTRLYALKPVESHADEAPTKASRDYPDEKRPNPTLKSADGQMRAKFAKAKKNQDLATSDKAQPGAEGQPDS